MNNADGRPPDGPPPDAGSYAPPAPIAVPLSATGPDHLYAGAAGPGGAFYVAGFAASGVAPTDPRVVVVARLGADGVLDPAFGGGDGVATTTVEFAGGTDEIDLAVQTDGKIVVSATVAAVAANDRDVIVFRLLADGTLDTQFGAAGTRRLDLNTGHDPGGGAPLVATDAARAISLDASDRIYVHAVQRGEVPGGRTDSDFAVIRLTRDGGLDATYGAAGKHLLDITGGSPAVSLNATPRALVALASGAVLGSGYTTNPSLGPGPQVVLYALDPDGALVPGFAAGGLYHDLILTTQTEIYGLAVHGGDVVTAGYGRESGSQNDWVSLRFDTVSGARDATWGGASNGAVVFDVSAAMIGDNCRNAVALPGGATVLVGSTGPANDPAQDAVFAVLSATGALDPRYGDGVHRYGFGGGAGGNDSLWGGAVNAGRAVLVGYRGAGATQTTAANDDAYAVILPIE